MNLADAPRTWADAPPMSTLEALLIFVGIPALAVAIISLLVIAPSLVKGPRYRPGRQWDAEPEWFGGPPELEGGTLSGRQQLTGSEATADTKDTGGASARW